MNTPKDAKPVRKGGDAETSKAPDITALSDEELSSLIVVAEAELSSRREKARSEFFATIREQARTLGFDTAEIAAAFSRKGSGKRPASDRRAAVAPKYRNPANAAETWSGRGVKPKWMQALIAEGKKPEDFKIDE